MFSSHGSRKSATQGRPVRAATAAPIRCREFGGDVVTMASMLRLRAIRLAAGTAFRSQGTALSGTSRRGHRNLASTASRRTPLVPRSASPR